MARGDHLYVNCSLGSIPYRHHGIDMGDGTVIHLAPANGNRLAIRDRSENFAVRRVSLAEFCQGGTPRVVTHEEQRSPDEVVAAAEEMLGRTGYCLLEGNCEHFATLCATGQSNSHQIEMGEATVAAMTSMATKAFWSLSSQLGSRALVRGALRLHPAALLADGVEIAALAVGCQSGLNAKRSRRLAKVSGSIAAAGIGGIVGGPAGAIACLAAHQSSSAIADRVCHTIRNTLASS